MKSADRRRVSVVGMDQWSAMADVMHLVVEYGHRSVLYFAGPKEWRDAATRLLAWNKLCAANAVNSVTVQCETWESSEAYGKMNHILDNIGRTGGNLRHAWSAPTTARPWVWPARCMSMACAFRRM